MSPLRFQILWLALSVAMSACAPLIRFGEIEPPEGTRTIIDVEVKPKPKPGVRASELAAVFSDTSVGVLVTTQLPVVGSSDASDEMASNVQGASVPAEEALVDEAQLTTDARRLESIYMARGYFRAKSLGHDTVLRGKDRAAIEFNIIEGTKTTVSKIEFVLELPEGTKTPSSVDLGGCVIKVVPDKVEEDPDKLAEDPDKVAEDPDKVAEAPDKVAEAPDKTEKELDSETLKRLRELCSEADELIPMLVGDVWTEDAYANGLNVLARAFRAAGFLHSRVSGDNWVSRDKGLAMVSYQIDSGPLVRVMGEVIIEGNVHVGLDRIRRRIDIKEGDVLDDELLRTTELNVQELGPFFSVQAAVVREPKVEPPAPPDAPKVEAPSDAPKGEVPKGDAPDDAVAPEEPRLDTLEGDAPKMSPTDAVRPAASRPERMYVKVQVAEAPRWEFTIGPSVVTDFLRLDLALPMAFTHRNLFSEVVAVTASARPAIVLPNCFTGDTCFAQPEFGLEAKAGLQVPSFFEEYLRFSVDATYERDPTQEAKTQEVGGSVGFSRRLIPGLTARLGYNIAFFNYFGTSALSGLSPEEKQEQQTYLIEAAALRFERQDFLAWLDATLVLDLRDSPLDARNGFFTSLSLNLAATYTGSDVPYTRLLGDVRGYWTPRFLKWLTLAARLKVGANFFESGKGTPQPARFKSGGATSMRGFSTDRIGDFLCAEAGPDGSYLNNPYCKEQSTQRTYIGGNYVIESNFELRFHLRGGIGLVWFADIGRVWSIGGFSLDDIYVATGPGFRYDLPVGPIRFDVGFLLGERRATEIHFSLGQAF